jgi:2'-5' RNA ligase
MVHADTFRGFIGLVPPADALEGLGLLRDRLLGNRGSESQPAASRRWRPVPAAALHLTLKFLGPIRWDQVPDLEVLLRRVAASSPPVVTEVGGRLALPDERRARVLALRVSDPTDTLKTMAHALDREAAAFGFPLETLPFLAHITVARRAGGRRVSSPSRVAAGADDAQTAHGATGVTGAASTLQSTTYAGSSPGSVRTPGEGLTAVSCVWDQLVLFRSNGGSPALPGVGVPPPGVGDEAEGGGGSAIGVVAQREGRYTQIVAVPMSG